MTFAFFLGAGNIIFPPIAGQLAGDKWLFAMAGFLVTAVGLPLIALLACAKAAGGIKKMAKPLPRWTVALLIIAIYSLLGPLFAAPRAALVSYEIGFKSSLSSVTEHGLVLFSGAFFVLCVAFSWSKGKLTSLIGRYLTPCLIAALSILSITVVMAPYGPIAAPSGAYQTISIAQGLIEGYKTMDTFAALMFGMLIINVLKQKGATCEQQISRELSKASLIAAACLGSLYVSLFYLGATSAFLVPDAQNGGQILSAYVVYLFSEPGLWVFSILVTLACMVAATGLLSACADCFSEKTPGVGYRAWLVLLALTSIVVANIGLTSLLKLAEPVLFLAYPVAIALVILTLLGSTIKSPKRAFQIVLSVALLSAIPDVIYHLNNEHWLAKVPFANIGLAWLLPTSVAIAFSLLVVKPSANKVELG